MKLFRALPWLFLGLFVVFTVRDFLRSLVPTSYWMEVASVHVADTTVGQSPKMVVARVIYHQFVADWVASVRRVGEDGLELVCKGQGRSDYVPTAILPEKLDLKWWTGADCPLTEGKYLIDTTWVMQLDDDYGKRTVTVRSNIFEVRT